MELVRRPFRRSQHEYRRFHVPPVCTCVRARHHISPWWVLANTSSKAASLVSFHTEPQFSVGRPYLASPKYSGNHSGHHVEPIANGRRELDEEKCSALDSSVNTFVWKSEPYAEQQRHLVHEAQDGPCVTTRRGATAEAAQRPSGTRSTGRPRLGWEWSSY